MRRLGWAYNILPVPGFLRPLHCAQLTHGPTNAKLSFGVSEEPASCGPGVADTWNGRHERGPATIDSRRHMLHAGMDLFAGHDLLQTLGGWTLRNKQAY